MNFTASKRYQGMFWKMIPRWLAPFADPSAWPHPHVEIEGIQIDEGIASVVVSCWRSGLATWNSCQGDASLYELFGSRHEALSSPVGNPHHAYITFGSVEDGLCFKRWAEAALRAQERHASSRVELCIRTEDCCFAYFDPADLSALTAAAISAEHGMR